jgi:hypothetical protein
VTRLQANHRGIRVPFTVLQPDHPILCSDHFPGGKAAWPWNWSLTSIYFGSQYVDQKLHSFRGIHGVVLNYARSQLCPWSNPMKWKWWACLLMPQAVLTSGLAQRAWITGTNRYYLVPCQYSFMCGPNVHMFNIFVSLHILLFSHLSSLLRFHPVLSSYDNICIRQYTDLQNRTVLFASWYSVEV